MTTTELASNCPVCATELELAPYREQLAGRLLDAFRDFALRALER